MVPAFGWFSEHVTVVEYCVCHAKITKMDTETVYRNLNAPLPGGSKLLTLSQGSLATPELVPTPRATPGIKSKFWLNRTSDYDSNAIVADDLVKKRASHW